MQEIPVGLICPGCKCPIAVASGRSTGMHCPRCNTWLDIDPACNGGSCFKCSVAHQAEASVCVETKAVHFSEGREISQSNVVQRSSGLWTPFNALTRLGKSVYDRLFHVR